MKISCICPTYNRVATRKYLLEEAVESFLRQTYADKELIILNDHPGQVIEFDHPQVQVVNMKERFKTLGEKYNYAISILADGDAICPWEDDDISLPHRLQLSVEKLGDADYFNPLAYFVLMGGNLTFEQRTGYAHNCSIFRHSAFDKLLGYPEVSGPQDAHMDGMLRQYCRVVDGPLSREEAFFIYRWGVSDMHLSGFHNTQKAYDDYALTARTSGTFTLTPHWVEEYERKIKITN